MAALPKRLAMVFYAPGALADELKERPAWFGPLLVGGLLVVASQLLVPRDLALEMMRLQFIEREQPVPAEAHGEPTGTKTKDGSSKEREVRSRMTLLSGKRSGES